MVVDLVNRIVIFQRHWSELSLGLTGCDFYPLRGLSYVLLVCPKLNQIQLYVLYAVIIQYLFRLYKWCIRVKPLTDIWKKNPFFPESKSHFQETSVFPLDFSHTGNRCQKPYLDHVGLYRSFFSTFICSFSSRQIKSFWKLRLFVQSFTLKENCDGARSCDGRVTVYKCNGRVTVCKYNSSKTVCQSNGSVMVCKCNRSVKVFKFDVL